MEKTDILVIGAGIIGLTIAKELSSSKRSVVLVERHESFGQEISSRNSEVIHGGMYYPEGSMKAELCIEGRRLLYKLCVEQNIPYKKTGKLIIATNEDELAGLNDILERGKKTGVEGLQILTKSQIKELEPEVNGIIAVYSPETGIIDSHSLLYHIQGAASKNGAIVVYNAEVIAIKKNSYEYKVTIRNSGENVGIKASVVINCAGLDSDAIALMAGIDVVKERYNLHYCKGQYFRVTSKKSKLINRPVYPVPRPESGGLGIHVTPDLSGNLRLGPDDDYIKNRAQDYSVDENLKNHFFNSVIKFLPFLNETDLTVDFSGIRPKLQPKGGGFRDFIISDESDRGLPGFINLIGIESPGLTASLAIAKKVFKLVCN